MTALSLPTGTPQDSPHSGAAAAPGAVPALGDEQLDGANLNSAKIAEIVAAIQTHPSATNPAVSEVDSWTGGYQAAVGDAGDASAAAALLTVGEQTVAGVLGGGVDYGAGEGINYSAGAPGVDYSAAPSAVDYGAGSSAGAPSFGAAPIDYGVAPAAAVDYGAGVAVDYGAGAVGGVDYGGGASVPAMPPAEAGGGMGSISSSCAGGHLSAYMWLGGLMTAGAYA